MNDKNEVKKINMPSLDASALCAAASSYRLRAAHLTDDDIASLEKRLRFLKTAERIDSVIALRFPAASEPVDEPVEHDGAPFVTPPNRDEVEVPA